MEFQNIFRNLSLKKKMDKNNMEEKESGGQTKKVRLRESNAIKLFK